MLRRGRSEVREADLQRALPLGVGVGRGMPLALGVEGLGLLHRESLGLTEPLLIPFSSSSISFSNCTSPGGSMPYLWPILANSNKHSSTFLGSL